MSETEGNTVEDGEATFDVSSVHAFRGRLGDDLDADLDVDELLVEVRALEEAKNAICARQARLTVAAHERQRERDVERGIDRATTARFVGSHVALAQRRSPHLGSRLLGLAHAVVEEMPRTYEALATGVIGEWDVTEICRETACLSREDRGAVDAALADDLGQVSHRRLIGAARDHAYRADPEACTRRRANAESARRVSLRPAPDCMTYLTALLPVKDGVACYAALKKAADAHPERPRGQAMADALVERITGRTRADGAGVRVNLLLPIDSLIGEAPAYVPDYGAIPADLAREWVSGDEADIQLRRIFTYPETGDLVGMDSRARTYPGLLAHLIRLRDHTCRMPYCDAPIRHIDHLRSHADGGPTSERNGAGMCVRCNLTKEHPDLHVTGDAGEITARTGAFTATSRPPAPPGMPPPTRSHVERTLIDVTWHHTTTRWSP